MGYRLEKLVIHNFKLFTHAEINTSEEHLIMLDGPNGYGKTSTFDALEYLYTGDVKRVSQNGVSKANIKFEEDCLTKSPSDGTTTYVKGVFGAEDNNRLEITRELSYGKGTGNNPSKISSRTKTSVVLNDEIICDKESVENANNVIIKYLGMSVISYYDQFFYIAQEDRLKFLSKSEDTRIKEIQKLFGIQEEEQMLNKIENVVKTFQNIKKEHSKKEENKKDEIDKLREILKENNNEEQVKYKDLVGDKDICPIWNQLHPQIENSEKLLELLDGIRAAGNFSRDIEWFKHDIKNNWIEEKTKDRETLKKYLYLNGYSEDLDKLREAMQQYYDITDMLEQAKRETGSNDYTKINFIRIKELLQLELDLEEIDSIKEDIALYMKNVKEEDEARASIVSLQNGLKSEWERWQKNGQEGLAENQCPLCGHPYDNKVELIEALDSYKQVIENGKGVFQKQVDLKIKRLEEIYNAHCKEPVAQYLNENNIYEDIIYHQIYENWDNVSKNYRIFREESDAYKIPMEYRILGDTLHNASEILDEYILAVKASKVQLSDEYCINNEKYQYRNIFHLFYRDKLDKVQLISESDENDKILYVQQEYYGSKQKELGEKEKELEVLQEKTVKYECVESNLKGLKEKVKGELVKYKQELVNQLKVPFYLYSGRILQNYPGGLGILMDIVGDEKIRFLAERRKGHDVLYTLSSGQLSAIAIAIALALNKIYAQDSMRCMFIDDPMQTMDELNIASFAEVLRTDFSEYQFILSTHEEDFSDYIRYKYDKYGLLNRSINVQDIDVKI